jgi:hypothetical protein
MIAFNVTDCLTTLDHCLAAFNKVFITTGFLNWVFGAGMGASFYVLTKAQPYLQNRSYDPKYNNTYICRFVIGIVSGVILALITNAMNGTDKTGLLTKLGPGMIAIIGGYSAEAVQLILQRLSDVITATVRGDNSSDTKAKLQASHSTRINDARSKLANARAAQATNDHKGVKRALDDLENTLKKSVA